MATPKTPSEVIEFHCPHSGCGAKLRAPAHRVGQQGTCPKCKRALAIGAVSEPPQPAVAAGAEAFRFPCPHCGKSIKALAKFVGRQGECPGCKRRVTVPSPQVPGKTQPAAATEPPAVAKPQTKPETKPQVQPRPASQPAAQPSRRHAPLKKAPPKAPAPLVQGVAKTAPPQNASAPKARDEARPVVPKTRLDAAVARLQAVYQQWSRIDDGDCGGAVRDRLRPVGSLHAVRNRLGKPVSNLLRQSLGVRLLGRDVRLGVYASNPWRFLAVPAGVDRAALDEAVAHFGGTAGLQLHEAAQRIVQVGYDQYLPFEDLAEWFLELRDERTGLLHRLFWPHVSAEAYRAVQQAGTLASEDLLRRWAEQIDGDEAAAARTRHALAVGCHNLAIAEELAYITGRGAAPMSTWQTALACWRDVLQADAFWDHLQRVGGHADAAHTASLVQAAREKLPAVVAAFNALFAREFALAGNHAACHRHLSLVENCPLPGEVCQALLADAVQAAYW